MEAIARGCLSLVSVGAPKRPRPLRAPIALGALAALAFACTRQADLLDEPPPHVDLTPPGIDAGIPVLDSGLDTDAYVSCTDRLTGNCDGTDDFPCVFSNWASRIVTGCQQATGCVTNGYLHVVMSSDGCVVELGMDEPNDAILPCLLAEFGTARCPCAESEIVYFFGYGNDGCTLECGKEFPCPADMLCIGGECVPIDAGTAGGG